ncbi:MAG: DUF3833 domain-containing protein [Alphaproteobacteria bacterium]|nr:DUF3833 domain-containing protein [Alphaproteobacteria bacterium]
MHPADFAATTPRFRPEQYFAGRGQATGFLQYRSGHPRRSFLLDIAGRYDGRTIVLDEVFRFGDGGVLERAWRFTRHDEHRYEATGDNVVGTARGACYGCALFLSYDIALEVRGKRRVVHFDDRLYLQPNGTVINVAVITKFGIKVGGLTAFFQRLP